MAVVNIKWVLNNLKDQGIYITVNRERNCR